MNRKGKGIVKERNIVRVEKEWGNYAARIAASLGLFDVIIFDFDEKTIRLVEVKTYKLPNPEKERILKAMKHLEGMWKVVAEVNDG